MTGMSNHGLVIITSYSIYATAVTLTHNTHAEPNNKESIVFLVSFLAFGTRCCWHDISQTYSF